MYWSRGGRVVFYKGCTHDITRRLSEHNAGYEKSTRGGCPWRLVWSTAKLTRQEALQLERKLKNITSRERMVAFISRHGGPDAPVGGLDADLR